MSRQQCVPEDESLRRVEDEVPNARRFWLGLWLLAVCAQASCSSGEGSKTGAGSQPASASGGADAHAATSHTMDSAAPLSTAGDKAALAGSDAKSIAGAGTRSAAGAGASRAADAGATSMNAMNSNGASSAPLPSGANDAAIQIDQKLSKIRPEFLDYFWNNLDADHFKQWFPGEHMDFSWAQAPAAPGDLGAEVGASFHSTELIGGNRHELTVTYIDRAAVAGQITLEYAMVADVAIDGAKPVRWVVQYEPDGDNLHVLQQLETPASETADAWHSHLEKRMTNLSSFVRDWFQKQYVETELMKRGKTTITTVGEGLTAEYQLVIEQPIGKLTPDMMDWWWDNIKDTMRYHRWHPTAHQMFTWTTRPKNEMDLEYDVGAVQQIVEVIGSATTLNIQWLDPSMVPVPLTYDHFVYGSTMLDGLPFGGFLLHEYASQPDGGGIVMKSTFRIPTLAGMEFANALAAHCVQEMQFLQYFVPGVFAAEYHP